MEKAGFICVALSNGRKLLSRKIDEISRKGLIAAPRGYDSIRKYLAECDYHTRN